MDFMFGENGREDKYLLKMPGDNTKTIIVRPQRYVPIIDPSQKERQGLSPIFSFQDKVVDPFGKIVYTFLF